MSTEGGNPNILLIIADDLGKDLVDITGTGFDRTMRVITNDGSGNITGQLPNLSLCLRNGVNFTHAWAQPACSPTRASIYTGLHPWKTSVGSPVGNPELDTTISLATLPEVLPSEYVSGLFGKWHLGDGAATSPIEHGWDKHVGTLKGVVPSYYAWPVLNSDGIYDQAIAPYSTEYVTTATAREATDWINAQDADTPWFATIAFHTPHSATGTDKFEAPPAGTTGLTSAPIGIDTTGDHYRVNLMTQNMDYTIGEMLGTVTGGTITPIDRSQLENTIIIFIGDNGSDVLVATEEEKTFIFEGSVSVPMIIADGNAVMAEVNGESASPRFLHYQRRGSTTQAMAHVIDIYATVLGLVDPNAHTNASNTDSVDLSEYLTTPIVVWSNNRGPGRPPIDPTNPNDFPTPPFDLPTFTIVEGRESNFAQWYTAGIERATIRNNDYKLNFDRDPNTGDYSYALYRFEEGVIPGREDDGSATDIYDDALNGIDVEAQDNLNQLLDELINNYQANNNTDESSPFPDPR